MPRLIALLRHFCSDRFDRQDDRGVSEVTGAALLIAIVIIGLALVLVIGGTALAEQQRAAELGQAQHALVQLDSKAAAVAMGETPVEQVDLGFGWSRGSLTADPDAGSIVVTHVDHLSNERIEVVNASLGVVVYSNGDSTVGYQGGGVWRSDGEDSVMISRPEFHFRENTLTMPIIQTRGDSVHSDVDITRTGPADPRFPNEAENLTNRVDNALVEIKIQSEYYLAWGRYFEDDTQSIVWYDHGEKTVTIQFLALPTHFSPQAGVIATSGPGEINMRATGAYIDSYDSREGSYEDSHDAEGRVDAAGDIDMGGDARIDGDVNAGRDLILGSSSNVIDGNANYTRELDRHSGSTITGEVDQIDGVPSIPPIDRFVDQSVADLYTQNDNDETPIITGNHRLDIPGDSGTLTAGHYYLEHLELHGQELVLDTSDGDIIIGVRDWVQLDRQGGSGGEITVQGDGNVRVFVQGVNTVTATTPGLGEQELHLHVGRNSAVEIPGDRSPQLVVLAKSDFRATIGASSGNPAYFTGVIYGPAGFGGSGWVHLMHAELYGGVVTGSLVLDNQGQVHFDHAIDELELPLAPGISRLEYLYATLYEVEVAAR